ncbi:MAG: anthranilate synthase component I family protein [Gaiella sp.]
MLEVWEPDGAFARLESWLRDQGFFAPGGEHLLADVFLAYGLSSQLQRGAARPPEPCRLPLIAARLRGDEPQPVPPGQLTVGAWQRSWTAEQYRRAVAEVRAAIARGDVYQVNLVQHLQAQFDGTVDELARRLQTLSPLIGRAMQGEGWAVASASPELFLERRGAIVRTMPIKGTRAAGDAASLMASPKDAAEHMMIVDLERNDLSRVCEAGSVRWPSLMEPRHLAGVEHLVSTVEGRLRAEAGLTELLEATFPGGSITGAPKIAAVDLIASLEPVGRGASMGALGWIRGDGDLELALTIRTFAIADGELHFWVGGGIVWDSDPQDEVDESWTKARPVFDAIGAPLPGGVAA